MFYILFFSTIWEKNWTRSSKLSEEKEKRVICLETV